MEDGMKAMSQCVAVIVLVSATLVGCASSPSKGAPGDTVARDNVDWKRVGVIDAAARHAGVDVHWINYPRKTQP
jgi:hypothetical protein